MCITVEHSICEEHMRTKSKLFTVGFFVPETKSPNPKSRSGCFFFFIRGLLYPSPVPHEFRLISCTERFPIYLMHYYSNTTWFKNASFMLLYVLLAPVRPMELQPNRCSIWERALTTKISWKIWANAKYTVFTCKGREEEKNRNNFIPAKKKRNWRSNSNMKQKNIA